MALERPIDTSVFRVLETPVLNELNRQKESYPFLFAPTYERYRHDEFDRAARKAPGNVFVCCMGDLFGSWIESWVIEEVFERVLGAKKHNYLFLTKNPSRYDELTFLPGGIRPDNMYFGATIDSQGMAKSILEKQIERLNFLCIEPILTAVDLGEFLDYSPGKIEWVILGAENGNRKGKVVPKTAWLQHVSTVCKSRGIPLFMKRGHTPAGKLSLLEKALGVDFRQEYPASLAKNALA